MTFSLKFKTQAKKEWDKLDSSIRDRFAQKLRERRNQPHIPSSRLRGLKNCYKIKLRGVGFRLVYEVRDQEVVIVVVAIGKRERNSVYHPTARPALVLHGLR
ncbi:MAG TPA: type II toxin-antitoxin system RelE/ParE family toxin [Desulfomicrobiaceae bacterium]|nr:type II toxin-antitoxin system RelE/ParE family toxin [Desulfomicrobiaceae bacterium]